MTPELLKKYAQSRCDSAERQLVEAWLASDDEGQESKDPIEELDEAALGARLLSNILPTPPPQKSRRLWLWRAAAAILIIVSLGIILQRLKHATPTEITWATLHAAPGKKLTVKLSDGSHVTLNSNSRIWYSLSENHRIAILEGEALFDVAKDTLNPFYVHTRHGNIRVVGTSFTVSTYPYQSATKVDVRSGKVVCTPKSTESYVALQKGESITFNRQLLAQKILIHEEDIALWASNILAFDHESLPEVFRKIESWFNVQIHTTANIGPEKRDFRSHFKNPSLSAVMESLCYSLKLQYHIEGNTVYIYK